MNFEKKDSQPEIQVGNKFNGSKQQFGNCKEAKVRDRC